MALLGFLLAAGVTWARGWRAIPSVHDETSFVLAADTFARGRLTNPTPPFPEHFETFHVLVRPSYASKYPPAPGLTLAVGQLLTGKPVVGVWITTGILCAVLIWMLLAWFPVRWALWGSVLIMLLLVGTQDGYWMSTFWGGTVAATGAALVYGSVRRITQGTTSAAAAAAASAFALGLGVLALSRPFEGVLVAIPALVLAAHWLLRDTRKPIAWRLRTVALPFGAVMAAIAAFALIYSARITGHALRMPYMEYEAQYSQVPLFLISRPNEPAVVHQNDAMRRFYTLQREARREKAESLRALVRTELGRAVEVKRFLAPGLTLILLVAAATSRARRALLWPLAGTVLVLGASLGVSWFFPHYIAPVIAPWAILLTAGAERLSSLEPTGPPTQRTGVLLTWLVFAFVAAAALLTVLRLRDEQPTRRASWFAQRDSLTRSLENTGEKHLVLVSYGAGHDPDEEWVHNAASFETAPVLWARALAPDKDARLINFYRDRAAWRVQVDSGTGPFRLREVADSPHSELAKQ